MSIATSRVHPLVPFDPICSPVHARAGWQRPVVEPFAARMAPPPLTDFLTLGFIVATGTVHRTPSSSTGSLGRHGRATPTTHTEPMLGQAQRLEGTLPSPQGARGNGVCM
jgi:hypothetical protein